MADVRIGHYELSRVIGKGNFAVVRLARHVHAGVKVAVKCVDVNALDRDQKTKLWREIDILQRVEQHYNILRLYEVMRSERHVMLVTEFCAGGEVFEQLVAHGRMSEPAARRYFRQVVAAVEHLHLHGIVHRDLKAENLLLSSDLKRVVLADFGFSNYFTHDALLSTWCGSPPYAAPELFEGKRYNGPRADIWSLGVVLYVLTCGALPFDGTTLQSLRTRVLQGKFRIPYFMTSDCEALLRTMLVVTPEKRATIAAIKAHRWMSVDDDDSEHTRPDDDALDLNIVEWCARELNAEVADVTASVSSRAFDAAYGLYHLVRDSTSRSAPPSPPLLPILPPQRKSSITTGVVERVERRHTTANSQTLPILFLTPPVDACHNLLNALQANFPMTKMDLLKPPPTFLVNSQMGRRASDGQASYSNVETRVQTQSASAFHFTSPPRARKRHSLGDTTTRRDARARRRASDGGTTEVTRLQSELRALCVSSPPSLHTSPIHAPQSPPPSPLLPALPEHVVTPPQMFRSTTPTLTLTDSDGVRKFPILPPPPDFDETLHRWDARLTAHAPVSGSLQYLRHVVTPHLTTTGSDNFIFEEETARRLRLDTLLSVKETEIALEWTDGGRRLVLRRVSGDANVYRDAVMAMVAASVES